MNALVNLWENFKLDCKYVYNMSLIAYYEALLKDVKD